MKTTRFLSFQKSARGLGLPLVVFAFGLLLNSHAFADLGDVTGGKDQTHERNVDASREASHVDGQEQGLETVKPRAKDQRDRNIDFHKAAEDAKDWSAFDRAMNDLRSEEHRTGVSYVISGSLVTVGSMIAPFSTNDTATKFVYGVAQGVGVAAIGYGVAKLADSSEYDSFYES